MASSAGRLSTKTTALSRPACDDGAEGAEGEREARRCPAREGDERKRDRPPEKPEVQTRESVVELVERRHRRRRREGAQREREAVVLREDLVAGPEGAAGDGGVVAGEQGGRDGAGEEEERRARHRPPVA